ncbi:uncharacterized protein [Salminus brasiliensis]|uniref:uncharacterized protein n=1 Tax=Salminus brasiliensis TaxID=930266 RepID=UPI003B830AFC
MTGLFFLTFLVVTLCQHATGGFVSQLEPTVRAHPGLSTSLMCHTHLDGRIFLIFWIKISLDKTPVCVATSQTYSNDVKMCEEFENQSRVEVTWNQKTFNLSFSSVKQTDVATYVCGVHSYGYLFFGSGTKLILDEHVDVSPNTTIKDNTKINGFPYVIQVLAATNVVSIILIILLCHLLKKKRSGVMGEVSRASDNKTDEVHYAALNLDNKQRRTVQKKTIVNTAVIYGAVRHQEEL